MFVGEPQRVVCFVLCFCVCATHVDEVALMIDFTASHHIYIQKREVYGVIGATTAWYLCACTPGVCTTVVFLLLLLEVVGLRGVG